MNAAYFQIAFGVPTYGQWQTAEAYAGGSMRVIGMMNGGGTGWPRGCRWKSVPAAALALLIATAGLVIVDGDRHMALAQYDSQGRYVPSPFGKPRDPYRSIVPLYTGKPGGSARLPNRPAAYDVKPPRQPAYDQPVPRRRKGAPADQPIPTTAQCRTGWSKEIGVTRAWFKRVCKLIHAAPE